MMMSRSGLVVGLKPHPPKHAPWEQRLLRDLGRDWRDWVAAGVGLEESNGPTGALKLRY